jgi:hypothetical protein
MGGLGGPGGGMPPGGLPGLPGGQGGAPFNIPGKFKK